MAGRSQLVLTVTVPFSTATLERVSRHFYSDTDPGVRGRLRYLAGAKVT